MKLLLILCVLIFAALSLIPGQNKRPDLADRLPQLRLQNEGAISTAGLDFDALTTNALTANRLTTNALNANTLTTNALNANLLAANALTANPKASELLIAKPLNTETLKDPYLNLQLHDPGGRQLLEYIVRCALKPTEKVQLTDKITGQTTEFQGNIGLYPSWSSTRCGRECQELISACLLAHVNAFGVKAEISLSGPGRERTISERDIFPIREAAFYGNLFGSANMGPSLNANPVQVEKDGRVVNRQIHLSPGSPVNPFTNLYACTSEIWSDPVNYLQLRVCATGKCLAIFMGPCSQACAGDSNSANMSSGVYNNCKGTHCLQRWNQVLTTFLKQPCALVPNCRTK